MPTVDARETADFISAGQPLEAKAPRPFSSLVRFDYGALSHVGNVRTNNEDSFVIYRNGRFWEKLLTNLPEGELPNHHEEMGYVMAVADGMGGAAAGEVASRLSLRTGINLVLHAVKWAMKLDNPEEREKEIDEGIERGMTFFEKINQALVEESRNDPTLRGMGSTLTVSYSFGDDLFLFHIGDSRAYIFRDGEMKQLTRDQTMAQSLADAGLISPGALPKHRLRHVLTQVLGNEGSPLHTEVHHLQLKDGDRLLLCSDGLYDMVDHETLTHIMKQELNPQETCRALVEKALEKGGKDNVTVLVGSYGIPVRADRRHEGL
jgi:serine/threonine protein phosphatase PrpC